MQAPLWPQVRFGHRVQHIRRRQPGRRAGLPSAATGAARAAAPASPAAGTHAATHAAAAARATADAAGAADARERALSWFFVRCPGRNLCRTGRPIRLHKRVRVDQPSRLGLGGCRLGARPGPGTRPGALASCSRAGHRLLLLVLRRHMLGRRCRRAVRSRAACQPCGID